MELPKFIDVRGFLSFHIMHLLKKRKFCGDDLAAIIGKVRGTKLTPGTIYPTLKRLRESNLVKYKHKGRKKLYYLTKKGMREYKISKRIILALLKGLRK